MKVYFLSEVKAALKLDGEYVGIIDNFERWCEVDCNRAVLAEIIPDDNLQPVNFFICGSFFSGPPDFAEVYYSNGFRAIRIKEFFNKNPSLELILQQKFCNLTVTVYRQGDIFVSCEGESFENYPLPRQFENPRIREATVNGKKLLALYGGGYMAVITPCGKLIFLNEVENCSFGDTLEAIIPLQTCTHCFAECKFSYSDDKFVLTYSRTTERQNYSENLLPFVFFERALRSGDFAALLCDELKPKAKILKNYLGEFIAVTIPHEDFYKTNPDAEAAGLVYERGKNLYEIIYFAVDIQGGKIANIRPVQT
ncbi:MAG: hypothetical protein LUD27_06710 [Clostridia bacterium]|nr:hypothetical protein [Clostridia bacterium]